MRCGSIAVWLGVSSSRPFHPHAPSAPLPFAPNSSSLILHSNAPSKKKICAFEGPGSLQQVACVVKTKSIHVQKKERTNERTSGRAQYTRVVWAEAGVNRGVDQLASGTSRVAAVLQAQTPDPKLHPRCSMPHAPGLVTVAGLAGLRGKAPAKKTWKSKGRVKFLDFCGAPLLPQGTQRMTCPLAIATLSLHNAGARVRRGRDPPPHPHHTVLHIEGAEHVINCKGGHVL